MSEVNTTKAVLGLDPARLTGFAHSNGNHGVWDLGTGPSRLAIFRDLLKKHIALWGADVVAFEDASFGSPNRAVQALHNELRGLIKLAASEVGAVTVAYQPTSIKKFATDNGGADKALMMRRCRLVLHIDPVDDNECDALWILEAAKQGYLPESRVKALVARKTAKKQHRFKFR